MKYFPEYHHKNWGAEFWAVNKQEYCGKLLVLIKDKRLSWHYHNIKDEVFMVVSGSVILKYGETDALEQSHEVVLSKGECFHVYPGLRHQLIALEDSEIAEFSTQHFEQDSIRVIKGD